MPRPRLGRTLQRAAVFLAAVLTIGGIGASRAPEASAAPCDEHCYGIATWSVSPPSGFRGARVTLRTNCMAVDNVQLGEFTTNEFWVVDNKNGTLYWVEAGFTTGKFYGSGIYYFWNDYRYNGSYNEHVTTTSQVPVNTYKTGIIHYAGNGTWYVTLGPIAGAQSVSSLTRALILETSIETTAPTRNAASSSDLRYYSLQDDLISGWRSATGGAVLSGVDSYVYRSWASPYTHLQYGGRSC